MQTMGDQSYGVKYLVDFIRVYVVWPVHAHRSVWTGFNFDCPSTAKFLGFVHCCSCLVRDDQCLLIHQQLFWVRVWVGQLLFIFLRADTVSCEHDGRVVTCWEYGVRRVTVPTLLLLPRTLVMCIGHPNHSVTIKHEIILNSCVWNRTAVITWMIALCLLWTKIAPVLAFTFNCKGSLRMVMSKTSYILSFYMMTSSVQMNQKDS